MIRGICGVLTSSSLVLKSLKRRVPPVRVKVIPSHFTIYRFASLASKMVNERTTPQGVVVNWDFNHLKKEDILDITNKLVDKLKSGVDAIVASPNISYVAVLQPLLDLEQSFRNESELVAFPFHVAVDSGLRDASREASSLIEAAVVDVNMRVDLFQKLCAYRELCDKDNLSPEKLRALDKLIRDGKRNGLNLDEATREEIKKIKNELNEKALEFSKNCAEDKWEHLFSAEELDGVPATFLEGLDKDEATGKYKLTLKYPHLFPVTKECCVPETRRIMETANASKAMEANTKILEDILELRQREAELLGYANHAAYVQEELMANTPAKVDTFLRELAEKLQPLWAKERALWLSLKEAEFKEKGWAFTGKLEPWDSRYYMQKVEETQYSINQEEYKAYFPIEQVTSGLLEIYQRLLHVKFTLLSNVPVWHEEVQMYEVRDSRDSQDLLGYFYLDMYPRDGKYTHACCVPLQLSSVGIDGKRIPAVIAMLCNFPKPCGNRPALLHHNEVETYFHEFGHVMHSICSKTETVVFSGASGVERDFIECPSQMLENWVWNAAPLALMSKHYETGEALPENMVEKLVHSQKANAGAFNLRQIVLAKFDQRIHTAGGRCDTAKYYAETMKEVIGMDAIPNTNFSASFGHLAHGYSARYYSYLWSEVFSMDMFDTVFGNELMDPKKGLFYREQILEPAGSEDATVLLKNFLGRDPQPEAFLKSKGIQVAE